jgi:glycosyltransferase involved in cell wall biosynthesis
MPRTLWTLSAAELVSVVIPAYNAARYLGEAIESVARQSHDRVEIIVVDDASTDDTAAVVARFGTAVRYLLQPHLGDGAARNRGVGESTGSHLAFLDADDLWEPDKLTSQLDALRADPTLDIVFGHVIQFWSPELSVPPGTEAPDVGEPMRGEHPGTMLLRRAVFDEIGPFREDHVTGTFVDWYARALDGDRNMLMLEAVVMRRRLHETNMGRVSTPEDYASILRRVIDRRRGRDA